MVTASIIMPCFNHGKYIDEAVESALAQRDCSFEIIIVNDGSTDTYTNDLLASYSKPHTRVITTKNNGPSIARNIGISEAKGKYILPLDADDKIAPDYLAKTVAIMEKKPEVGIVYCDAKLFGSIEAPWALPEFTLEKMLMRNIIFSTALFRKDDWKMVGGYESRMAIGWEDWDFWLSIIEIGRKVAKVPECLFYYRQHGSSRNNSFDYKLRSELHAEIFRKHTKLYSDNINVLFEEYYSLSKIKYSLLYKALSAFKDPKAAITRLFNGARQP